MEEQINDQGSAASDHNKFDEASSHGASQAPTPRVYDKVDESAETLRERAVQLKTSIADKLEASAGTLRRRASDTARIDEAIKSTKEKVADASDRVASGMEKSAEWLRDADMSMMKRGLERQVREKPALTLLVASAIGFMLGRAFKGKGA